MHIYGEERKGVVNCQLGWKYDKKIVLKRTNVIIFPINQQIIVSGIL